MITVAVELGVVKSVSISQFQSMVALIVHHALDTIEVILHPVRSSSASNTKSV